MKLFRNMKLLAIAVALCASAAPAFADGHKQIQPDWGLGIIQGAVDWVVRDIMHFWTHIQMLSLAAETKDVDFFLAQNMCASAGFLTSVFFTWYGLLSLATACLTTWMMFKRRKAHKALAIAT